MKMKPHPYVSRTEPLLLNFALSGLAGVAQAQRPPTIAEMQNADYVLSVCSNISTAANILTPPQYKDALGRTGCAAINADLDPAKLAIVVATDAPVFASKENKRVWLTHVSIIVSKSLEEVPKFRVYQVWFADGTAHKTRMGYAIAPDKLRRPVALFVDKQPEAGYAELTKNLTPRRFTELDKRKR